MKKEKQTKEKTNFLKRLERLTNQDVYFRHSTGKISGSIVEVNEKKEFVLIREKKLKKNGKNGNSFNRSWIFEGIKNSNVNWDGNFKRESIILVDFFVLLFNGKNQSKLYCEKVINN